MIGDVRETKESIRSINLRSNHGLEFVRLFLAFVSLFSTLLSSLRCAVYAMRLAARRTSRSEEEAQHHIGSRWRFCRVSGTTCLASVAPTMARGCRGTHEPLEPSDAAPRA